MTDSFFTGWKHGPMTSNTIQSMSSQCGCREDERACGIRSGLLPPSYRPPAQMALEGVLSTIKPDGELTGVSGGTPILKTIDEYGWLSRYPTLYGQGVTLMLLGNS